MQFCLRSVLFVTAVVAAFLGGWKLRSDVSDFENDRLYSDRQYRAGERVWYRKDGGWDSGQVLVGRYGMVQIKGSDGNSQNYYGLHTAHHCIRPEPNAVLGALVRRLSQ